LDDRFRGVKGTRMVILMNEADIQKRKLKEGQKVTLQTIADDGIDRRLVS
jgi:anaerobic selenocysteine-containing dehydrogenase